MCSTSVCKVDSLLASSYVWDKEGLAKVPASRSDVFKDRILSASEKRTLTLFLKTVVSEMEKRAFGVVRLLLTFHDVMFSVIS